MDAFQDLADQFRRGASQAMGFGPVKAFAGQSSYVLPFLAGIVAIALIVLIVFVVIQVNVGKPAQLLKGPVDLFDTKSPVIVDRPTTKTQMTGSYTLAFYVRIDATPDMRATAVPLITWPAIWNVGYNAAKEQLIWTFGQTADAPAQISQPETVSIAGVPMQRWTQIAITFEGRTADFYVNGTLHTSTTLNNVPPSANTSISIVPGGLIGQVAYVQVWPRRLAVADVAANYTDTSDSQGRPFLGPNMMAALNNVKMPNLFCPSGNCTGTQPSASKSQTWEFPYA
jgi:hypothetical protein